MENQTCPDCKRPLHSGQHKYADGYYLVSYCKECGYRDEKAMEPAKPTQHS